MATELSRMATIHEVPLCLVAFQKAIRGILSPNSILHFPSNFLLVTSAVKHIEKQQEKALLGLYTKEPLRHRPA